MDAKEYLQRVIFLKCKIQDDKDRVQKLKESAEDRTSKLTPDKVQTSTRKDKIGDTICSWVDIEREIAEDEAKMKEIIAAIKLLKPHESAVLYQVYVSDKTLGEVAGHMNHSYSWAAKKHRAGVKKIQAILDEREIER